MSMIAKQLLKKTIIAAMAAFGPQRWPFLHPRLLVLTYHRVLPENDPRYSLEQPGMVVTPETFTRQLEWLASAGFQFTHVSDWLSRTRQEAIPGKWCAITFDDGWQDNYEYAFPVLRTRNIPFEIYVVANRCDGIGDYWPGRLARALATMVTTRCDLTPLKDVDWLLELLPDGRLPSSADRNWIDRVVTVCKRHPESFIYPHLESLEQQLPSAPNDKRALLDEMELQAMLVTGLFQMGCHTANHVRLLEQVNDQTLYEEVVTARAQLEQRFGTRVTSFCYPNGDYSPAALALVRKHYACAVTTQTGWNTIKSDPFQLRRISIHEDATNTPQRFWAKVSGWL